jgi:hypothetical protein
MSTAFEIFTYEQYISRRGQYTWYCGGKAFPQDVDLFDPHGNFRAYVRRVNNAYRVRFLVDGLKAAKFPTREEAMAYCLACVRFS